MIRLSLRILRPDNLEAWSLEVSKQKSEKGGWPRGKAYEHIRWDCASDSSYICIVIPCTFFIAFHVQQFFQKIAVTQGVGFLSCSVHHSEISLQRWYSVRGKVVFHPAKRNIFLLIINIVIITTTNMVWMGSMYPMLEVLYTSLAALSSLSDWWLSLGAYARNLKQALVNKGRSAWEQEYYVRRDLYG